MSLKTENEKALDLFADLLEPAVEIIGDPNVAAILQDGGAPARAAKVAIKNHKNAVVEILARLDGCEPKDYKVNILLLPIKFMQLINKPEIQELFTLQAQKDDAASSGSATVTIKDGAV